MTDTTNTTQQKIKEAPGTLALIQLFVNTQYGRKQRSHVELAHPAQLRDWLVQHDLLTEDTPVTEGDFRRVIQLREALRNLLYANNEGELLPAQVEVLNHLASSAPLTVRFDHNGETKLKPDFAGVDGAIAQLIGIVFTAMTDGTWARLKACRNEYCQRAFYDVSKNYSGAWCSMATCGSRFKARTYRHRHMAQIEE
jgi:predicted RNA-binding Zn ribbon-like protein